MQPKYSQWINYAHNQFFFDKRKIRLFCPPKVTIPITGKDSNESLPRRQRVALIPPTERLAIILNQFDKEFVQREFPNYIRHINLQQQRNKKYGFWLKIVHVENVVQPNAIGAIDGSKLTKVDLYLMDMSSDIQAVVLSLYDEMAHFASIFRRNDYIALYDPLIQQQTTRAEGGATMQQETTTFEYSENTVIFWMPEKEAKDAGLAKINLTSAIIEDDSDIISQSDPSKKGIVERDEEVRESDFVLISEFILTCTLCNYLQGFMDCLKYNERIYIKDITHCMLNATLFGRIVGLANNVIVYHAKQAV